MNFIKLSRVIINTSKISTIQLLDNHYTIKVASSNTSGFVLAGSGFHKMDRTNLKKRIFKIRHYFTGTIFTYI
jgi:hypothetical protein